MQKKFLISYFVIFAIILTMMSLSRHSSEKLRGQSAALMAPFWEKILAIKYYLFHPSQPSPFSHFSKDEEKERVELENQLLEIENAYLQKLLNEQLLISSQIAKIASAAPAEAHALSEDYQQSLRKILDTMQQRIQAVPARVIFRSLDTWNSFLWINAGESINRPGELPIVALNSPIIRGKAVVGIIDYVGNNQSRVRLISDCRLNPSVRAARGGEQDFLISDQIERLSQQLSRKKDFSLSESDQNRMQELLLTVKQSIHPLKKSWYLAKGELLGSLYPSRNGQTISLKGGGFNYDFPDEEGSSRDLRSGKSKDDPYAEAIPILKSNDLLVTTGMDGIFPPGFHVAVVTKIELLKEGDYYYDVEAKPVADPLEELALVFVLPPISAESNLKVSQSQIFK
jgi:cell shape-determining protein MreC